MLEERLIFYSLMTMSSLCLIFLILAYSHQKQNFLLRSCCFIILVAYGIITFVDLITGHSNIDLHNKDTMPFAENYAIISFIQAVLLNSCFISIHSHIAMLMLSNRCNVVNKTLFGFSSKFVTEWVCVAICLGIPIVAAFTILLSIDPRKPLSTIYLHQTRFFYITDKRDFMSSSLWYISFATVGIASSLSILHSTLQMRETMKHYSDISQFRPTAIARITLAFFLYIMITFGSFFPVINYHSHGHEKTERQSYLSVCIGVVLFIFYGFGTTSREFLKSIRDKFGNDTNHSMDVQ